MPLVFAAAMNTALDIADQANNVNNPVAIARYNHAETFSASNGGASNTANFTTNGGDDDSLDGHKNITYLGNAIGTLVPLAVPNNGPTYIKMHLVNSFLHAQANDWPANWFWGSPTLNHLHNQYIEEPAKQCHPVHAPFHLVNGIPVAALNYRTEADQAANANFDANDMAARIRDRTWQQAGLISLNNNMVDAWPSQADFLNNALIGGQTIANYMNSWQAAVPNAVRTQVTGYATSYAFDNTTNTVVSQVELNNQQQNYAEDPEPKVLNAANNEKLRPLLLKQNVKRVSKDPSFYPKSIKSKLV